jgi:hypothetical protein
LFRRFCHLLLRCAHLCTTHRWRAVVPSPSAASPQIRRVFSRLLLVWLYGLAFASVPISTCCNYAFLVVLVAQILPVKDLRSLLNASKIVPKALLLLNASRLCCGNLHQRPRPRLQAELSSTAAPLLSNSTQASNGCSDAPTLFWNASWWLTFELRRRQWSYSWVARGELTSPVAFAPNRPLAQFRLQAPSSSLPSNASLLLCCFGQWTSL